MAVALLAGCSPNDTITSPTSRGNTNTSTTTTTFVPPTVARQMSGRWATDSSVTFIYQTDFCGSRRDVARALWNVTWDVTAVSGYTNVVDVEMRFTRGSSTVLTSCNPTGWVPAISPTEFRLCFNTDAGTFSRCEGFTNKNGYAYGSFTSDTIRSTWTHWECIIYCSGERTEEGDLRLSKRS